MKILLSTLFILMTSVTFFGQDQYLESTSSITNGIGEANGGKYNYKATVKCRANAPGLGDVRLQCSILSFEITSFEYAGTYYYRSEQGFPIVIDKIQSELDGIFKFTKNIHWTSLFEHKIAGVRKGAFDIKYLTDEEVKSMELKTSKDFYELEFNFDLKSLTNTYFDELDNYKNGLIKDQNERRVAEKKQTSNDGLDKWKADQKWKADLKVKVLESEARIEENRRKAEEKRNVYNNQFKTPAQLQEEENTRRTNIAMNNVNYYLNQIEIANKERIDARRKIEARERKLAAKARVQKINDDYKEAIRQLDLEFAGTFSDGLAPTPKDNGYIYINRDGQKAIPGNFDHAKRFHDGFAVVGKGGKYDYKKGVINTSGELIIPYKYDWIGLFYNGLAIVEKDDKMGLIDINDKAIIPIIYDDLTSPSSPKQYSGTASASDELIMAELDGKFGFIDINNNVVIPFISSKYAAMKRIDGSGKLIDRSGKLYDEIYDYHEGLALVRKGLYGYEGTVDEPVFGYIDKDGHEVFPLIFKNAWHFSEGLASVQFDGKYGCIDYLGKTVIPFEYDNISMFHNGLAIVRLGTFPYGGRHGVIDKDGNIIIPLEYATLKELSDGLLLAKRTDDGDWGFIDLNNKVVIPFIYEEAKSFENGSAQVGVAVDEWWKVDRFHINKKGECIKGCD